MTSVTHTHQPSASTPARLSTKVRLVSVRIVQKIALLSIIVLISLLSTALPISLHAAPAAQQACEFGNLGGLIMDRWRELGGSNSQLGCPLTFNEEIGWANKDARMRRFVNGEASYSPWAGGVVLAVWREPTGIRLWWKSTAPFNYDFWQIDWFNGGTELRGLPRSEGSFLLTGSAYRSYRSYNLTVQGCDEAGFLGRTTCRQGWFQRVFIPADKPDYIRPGIPGIHILNQLWWLYKY